MELFMRNVPYTINDKRLKQELASRLHGPFFAACMEEGPYNFIVRLFRDKDPRKRGHLGRGILLVPSIAIGYQFLEQVNAEPLVVYSRPIWFEEGKKKVKKEDLELLTEPYYEDPGGTGEQQRNRNGTGSNIKLSNIQFGWPSYDGGISIEWEGHSSDTWNVHFNPETRLFVIRSQLGVEILVSPKNIQSTAFDSKTCLIYLERPPIFRKERSKIQDGQGQSQARNWQAPLLTISDYYPEFMDFFGVDDDFGYDVGWGDWGDDGEESPPIYDRMSSPDQSRSDVFAFLLVIRLIFDGRSALEEFKYRAEKNRLPTYSSDNDRISRQGLFDPLIMHRFGYWLKGLPFEVAFQLHGLVSRRRFNPKELLAMRCAVNTEIYRLGHLMIAECIRLLEQHREPSDAKLRVEEPPEEGKEGYCNAPSAGELFATMVRGKDLSLFSKISRNFHASRDIFQCHRVMVTPTSLILTGPLPDETNRVLRKYENYHFNFIRVEFREENRLRLQLRLDKSFDTSKFIDERFGGTLQNGLIIGGRKFEFLAYSSSALKEHAVWFIRPFFDGQRMVNAESIRTELGDFSKVIHYPALYGARIAQAFSSTERSITVRADQMVIIDDRMSSIKSVFTDGVGTMSQDILNDIWSISGLRRGRRHSQKPYALQIRMGGSKGMLCVDSRLQGKVVCTRPSMNKFISEDRTIELARVFDRPMAMYLNRPLIMLLDTLGVPLDPFMKLQKDAVNGTKAATASMDSTAELLEKYGLGNSYHMPSLFLDLHKINVGLRSTRQVGGLLKLLQRVQTFAENHILRDIKYKARILVPRAWTLVGVADEYDYLEEGEIYAYVCNIDGRKEYIEGPVLISRSPTVHPGDARMVRAIGKPPPDAPIGLAQLTNCVVFSCKGQRSLPSMLAGGDLDGDIYCLVMDKRLHPNFNFEPANYDSPKRVSIDGPSTARDLAQFVVDFIKNDILGLIATQILLTADDSPDCMADSNCLILAKLHSDAVDYPKTGRPVNISLVPRLFRLDRPDWYAKETEEDDSTYRSERHLGHLFRAIELPATVEVKRVARKQRAQLARESENMEIEAVLEIYAQNDDIISRELKKRIDDHVDLSLRTRETIAEEIREMLAISDNYAEELEHVCTNHSLPGSISLTEEEIVTGTIVAKCSQPRARTDNIIAMRRESLNIVTLVREEIEGSTGRSDVATLLRAWTAWKVSVASGNVFGARSFGLIALEMIFSTIRKLDRRGAR